MPVSKLDPRSEQAASFAGRDACKASDRCEATALEHSFRPSSSSRTQGVQVSKGNSGASHRTTGGFKKPARGVISDCLVDIVDTL